jgi:hypothetical protein
MRISEVRGFVVRLERICCDGYTLDSGMVSHIVAPIVVTLQNYSLHLLTLMGRKLLHSQHRRRIMSAEAPSRRRRRVRDLVSPPSIHSATHPFLQRIYHEAPESLFQLYTFMPFGSQFKHQSPPCCLKTMHFPDISSFSRWLCVSSTQTQVCDTVF